MGQRCVSISLEKYKKKRDFRQTSEPEGNEPKKLSGGKLIGELLYVIQKHDASRLHWDLRLEMDGVLKSWAVPKEPPQIPNEKRLAVEVEDHPIEYGSFEGIIPEGHYGTGTVEIWDRGHYDLIELEDNMILFDLRGNRLQGRYCLVRFQPEKDPKNWLFFKKKVTS